jgi:hypothetical protein
MIRLYSKTAQTGISPSPPTCYRLPAIHCSLAHSLPVHSFTLSLIHSSALSLLPLLPRSRFTIHGSRLPSFRSLVPLFPWSLGPQVPQSPSPAAPCSYPPLPPAPTPRLSTPPLPRPLRFLLFCSLFPCSLGLLFPAFYPPPALRRPHPPMPVCETVKL